jgi:hypothetical protein
VGAYQIADREYDEAVQSFELAMSFAAKADAPGDELLNQGYILITKLLAVPADSAVQMEYESLKEQLRSIEHGDDFIQQLETAHKVFSEE